MINFALAAWSVANLLHPFVMKAYEGPDGWFPSVVGFFLIMLPFSIPSLILSIFFLQLIKEIRVKILFRYILWLLSIPLIVIINMECLGFLIIGEFYFGTELLQFIAAPSIAAVIASFILGPYFSKQMNEADIFRKDKEEVL